MDDTTNVTYAKLFPGQVADKCSPYALESNTGPLAYLHALYEQVQSLEANADKDLKITLASRRPDIGERLLDQGSLDNQVYALPLAIDAMTRQAKAHLGKEKNLAQAISESIYPAQLPFHYALETIKAVIGRKGSSLFNLLQQLEFSFPSFSYGYLRTEEIRGVMRKATGFSPALQSLLLNKSAPSGARFLGERYGVTSRGNDALKQLSDAEYFCSQAGLATEDIFDLLAVASVSEEATSGVTAVKQSVHVTSGADAAPMSGHSFGAVFINNAKQPALSLEDALVGEGISLRIKEATADHFGRIHKIIHLKHALKLPYDQVDTLVMAAMRAEGQTKDFHITENTLRALGVYEHLHAEYGVTAEQFAALIGGVTPYAVGENRPFLDRVLDGPDTGQLADIDAALMIDGRAFVLDPPADSESQRVTKSITGYICRAFAIDELSAKNYLLQITKELNLTAPALTLPVISSLYRLTRLPRLLRLGMVEGNCLIALLADVNPQVLSQLAGQPVISDDDEKPDILDVLIGITNLEKWVREQKISARTLLGWMTPLPTDMPDALKGLYGVDERTRRVVLDAIPRLKSTLISESKIAEGAGPNVSISSGTWLNALQTYVDSNGLVKVGPATSTQSLVQTLTADLNGKLRSSSGLNLAESDVTEVAGRLEAVFRNAAIAQEDIARHLLSAAFSHPDDGMKFTSEQAMPLLRWTNETPFSVLKDVLSCEDTLQTQTEETLQKLDIALWNKLARHAGVLKALRMSGAGLNAMLDHPGWFDLEDEDATDNSSAPPALTLDLCYQLSRYRDWVQTCQRNGYEEVDALNYLAMASNSDRPYAAKEAAQRLAQLIGWSSSETLLASPYLRVAKQTPIRANDSKTFDDFLGTLTPLQQAEYLDLEKLNWKGLATLISYYVQGWRIIRRNQPGAVPLCDRFKAFVEETGGSIKVSAAQYLPTTKPKLWENLTNRKPVAGILPITLQISSQSSPASVIEIPVIEYEEVRCAPNAISDIDLILRTQAQCSLTGLSCQSIFDLYWLDHESDYEDYQASGQLLLAASNESILSQLEPVLQEQWRDALAAYLMGYWVPSSASLKTSIASIDDLSSYFLTDIFVSSTVTTTAVIQATAGLQHYLHRLYARLEPGYKNSTIEQDTLMFWRKHLSEYATWKKWSTQVNHPENLIYYANRPDKSTAFQTLEVELNQGKLDTELLQTAITSYLTKFESTSNLQIVSGYLDGLDPKNDTYHFIGKTNTAPAEYYWRSVDMGLRDDKERLSPLAWSEWEKIGLAASGQIVQSSYTTDTVPNEVILSDAVRPVVIEGRPYVFWVERGTSGLPSADEKNQTPTKYKKITVQYIYLQSDGFWSPSNELLCLDGTEGGKRLDDDTKNPYLKDDKYVPGLIAVVNIEGDRIKDPWLTVMMYNCAYTPPPSPTEIAKLDSEKYGALGKDYFIQARDLLLIGNKVFATEADTKKFGQKAYDAYCDTTKIQHMHMGDLSSTTFVQGQKGQVDFDTELTDFFRFDSPTKITASPTKLESSDSTTTAGQKALSNKYRLFVAKPGESEFSLLEDKTTGIDRREIFTVEFPWTASGRYKFAIRGTSIDTLFFIYDLKKNRSDQELDISIKRTQEQAQYLDLSAVAAQAPVFPSNAIRLNTLFGKQLVSRATRSAEHALQWEAQFIKEPTIDPDIPTPPVDFHGANGAYFRELFLHLPTLVATRLSEQQQFDEAEYWYTQYLFDPYRTEKDEQGRPALWNTRPLAEVGTGSSYLQKDVDPTARAFNLSIFYRQAIFLAVVDNWQRQGDHFFRQVNPSSLNHAWLCYQKALKLIGPLPERLSVSRWEPTDLKQLTRESFRAPLNERVMTARKTLEHRLYNLRHGLTLDGKALPAMDWRTEGSDPFDFAQRGVGQLVSTYNSDRTEIPAYRFRQLIPMARKAVQQLQDMGRHYMKLLEDEDNVAGEMMLLQQEIRMSDFTLSLQKEAISSVNAQKRVLEQGKQAALSRKEFYADLIQVGRSPIEEAAAGLIWSSVVLKSMSVPFQISAGITEGLVPTIYGFAFGGNQPSAPMAKAALVMESLAEATMFTSEQLLLESEYERRAQEWRFDLSQTEFDLSIIDLELEGANIELNAALISLDEARAARSNLEDLYADMNSGFTILPTYNWLVARQELLYGPAYDAVLSLCLSAEAAWRYEIGDYNRSAFIKTSAWSDSYKGMLAAESLLVDLQDMENAYLQCNERRLTIRKTVDVKGTATPGEWVTKIKNLASAPLEFEFKSADFDRSYPGHYMRQLKHVSVSFVMEPGASANPEVSAILTQTDSSTLVEPDFAGAQYLYQPDKKPPSSVKRNLRVQQQIALSSRVADDGLGFGQDDWVYELMFHDGRYLPFEGTGAVSRWQISFPGGEFVKTLLTSDSKATLVKTIQIHLVYTALDGGQEFTDRVKGLMTPGT
jgi:hypothetical protein